MIELFHFAWSPYCLVQRRLLEYGRIRFRLVDIHLTDRSLIWRLTRERYYQVPVLKDGRQVVFETDADSQVIAKYLDSKFNLGLFPREWDGVQDLLWRYFENDLESYGFKLNDIHWEEFVPKAHRCGFVRHKERKFGRGCLQHWAAEKNDLLAGLERGLVPVERMLAARPWLLSRDGPLFVDFCLYGMLANFLYTGHYKLPAPHQHLQDWYRRVVKIKSPALVV